MSSGIKGDSIIVIPDDHLCFETQRTAPILDISVIINTQLREHLASNKFDEAGDSLREAHPTQVSALLL